MGNDKNQLLGESDVPYRRRGRPAGKNRVPLSREERRARNALYERERRNETAEVMSQLAEAVGCDPNISNADLLATVISRIERASRKNSSEDIAELEHLNANLESQIATLQSRLGIDDETFEQLDSESNIAPPNESQWDSENVENKNPDRKTRGLRKQNNKRKRSKRPSSEYTQPEKRIKTKSETWSETDSGIELRSHTRSPPELCTQQHIIECLDNEQNPVIPIETPEELNYDGPQENCELQAELYNQIYNSGFQSAAGYVTESNQSVDSTTQSDSMDCLIRSLIVVPSIVPPQQEQPDSQLIPQIDAESTNDMNIEPPCDLQVESSVEILPQTQTIYDFFTDTEKGLISDWIGGDFLEGNDFNNGLQTELRTFSSYDVVSGH